MNVDDKIARINALQDLQEKIQHDLGQINGTIRYIERRDITDEQLCGIAFFNDEDSRDLGLVGWAPKSFKSLLQRNYIELVEVIHRQLEENLLTTQKELDKLIK